MLQRVFSAGFRIFFLAAAIYGVFAGLIWVIWLAGGAAESRVDIMPFGDAPHLWHAHEMIFGYASAALGGFFLTAVPNWTGAKAAREIFIISAFACWLIGRLAVWYAGVLPDGLVMVADLLFIPILAAKIGSQLLKRPKPQNMMFLAILALFWLANLLVHLEVIGWSQDTADTGLRAGLLALCAMVAVLGGRVTPAFTRNAMKNAGEPEASWPHTPDILNKLTLIGALALPVVVMLQLPSQLCGLLAIAFGIVQLLRIKGWSGGWAIRQPLLAALHLGLSMLALGLILWGLAGLGIGSEVAGLHLIGIGGIGGMTLAVMGRATLGHSGRPLKASWPMTLGYGLIVAAAALRWLSSSLTAKLSAGASELLILGAGGMWVLAFTLFLIAIAPAILGPRVR